MELDQMQMASVACWLHNNGHRMCCMNCQWWADPRLIDYRDGNVVSVSECHRYPNAIQTNWKHWCGEFVMTRRGVTKHGTITRLDLFSPEESYESQEVRAE